MIDFTKVKPSNADTLKEIRSSRSASLFKFGVIEVVEHRLKESPRAASKLNDRMAICIAVFLFLIPVPYGANRPLAWLIAIAVIGLFTVGYFVMLLRLDPNRPVQLRNYKWVIIPGLIAVVWAACQLIPLGAATIMPLPPEISPPTVSVATSATLLGIPRMLSYALLFILISEVCTNRFRTENLLKWVFWGIVAHAVWALLSLSVFDDTLLLQVKDDYQGFATGTFVNRNSFATFMGMGFVVGMAMLVFEMRAPARRTPNQPHQVKGVTTDAVYIMILMFVIFAALLASASRLGLVSTLIGAWTTLVALLLRTGVSKAKIFAASIVLTLVVLIGGGGLLGPKMLERFVFLLADSDGRLELYAQTWSMIETRWLVGFGLDSYAPAFEVFHTPHLSTSFIWDKPHNTYLTLWSELGLIAGSLPMVSVIVAFFMAAYSVRNRQESFLPASAAVGVIVLGAVHSLGDFSLEIAANTYVFVAIVALGLARRSLAREL
ncbi:O-antigen ligase [Yoonia maritima]|uniref:O-antigen ligase n=1 Tax=Yoonia maritima TaxID=1435347 RepID=A0A2T0VZW8_9RHOB|nr:O-antigen ligase family protein [Yoonia maritima]PRY78059.1 O-antigen ligase [Yoonia maritima]